MKSELRQRFYGALEAAGLPKVPDAFSVVPQHQVIPAAVMAPITEFIRCFDRVTSRPAWRAAALAGQPDFLQAPRTEVCFFSAWDFHLPPQASAQLIEFNDNGSGLLFAGLINALYHEAAGLHEPSLAGQGVLAPATPAAFQQRIGDLVEAEAAAFFGERPPGQLLVLDDPDSLQRGKFRQELELLCTWLRQRGWDARTGSPGETRWDGRALLADGRPVSFVVNRSTDFFWQGGDFAALRTAFEAGRVYVAPNPVSYATRSDKRLLEWLSLPEGDGARGVTPEERRILSAHVPETHEVRADNAAMLAGRKQEFVFKPLHGYAGHGLLPAEDVGERRLRRLAAQGGGYVAQKLVPKPILAVDADEVWTDLRVWAWRGEIVQLSGRASRRPDRLDLAPPGGWLPTYVGS